MLRALRRIVTRRAAAAGAGRRQPGPRLRRRDRLGRPGRLLGDGRHHQHRRPHRRQGAAGAPLRPPSRARAGTASATSPRPSARSSSRASASRSSSTTSVGRSARGRIPTSTACRCSAATTRRPSVTEAIDRVRSGERRGAHDQRCGRAGQDPPGAGDGEPGRAADDRRPRRAVRRRRRRTGRCATRCAGCSAIERGSAVGDGGRPARADSTGWRRTCARSPRCSATSPTSRCPRRPRSTPSPPSTARTARPTSSSSCSAASTPDR